MTNFISGPGMADVVQSLKRIHVALYFAWSDTRARYRRSVLGPLWLTLGTVVGVVGLGWLWSQLLKINPSTFIPSLTAGLIIWHALAGCLAESTTIFVKQANVIRNLQLPYFLHPLQLVLRHIVNFSHNLIVYIAVVMYYSVPLTWSTLLVVPGIILLFLNLAWISLFIGILGVRFRDIEYMLASLLPLLFFISPVIYRPNYLSFSSDMIWLNPLSHLIEVVRDPLLGAAPPWYVYATVCGMLISGWYITLALFNTSRSRIAYWV